MSSLAQKPVEAVARRWVGRCCKGRQVWASLARGGPSAPELTREHRSLEVLRLRSTAEEGEVRAEQLFFREGPTDDRPFLAADQVSALADDAFVRPPGCDLFFRFEPQLHRWLDRQTTLHQGVDGGQQRIEASGELQAGRLSFESDRFRGWAMEVPEAPGATLLQLESRDGSNLRMREISQLSGGGRRRLRITQVLREGPAGTPPPQERHG